MARVLGNGRPLLKVARAREHLEALRTEIAAYRGGDAFMAEERYDASDGWIYLTLRVLRAPPLDRWALIFGDCIHSLRSALDHLAWQLDASPGRSTSFPIYLSKPDGWPTPAVRGMDHQAQQIIEHLQPYNVVPGQSQGTPGLHPLATLHRLDIADKHMVLTVTTGVVGGDSINVPFEASVESAGSQEWADGAPLGRVRLPSASQQLAPGSYTPYFNAVLLEPPLQSPDVMWVAEEVLFGWIEREILEPLYPFGRPDQM